jgi:glycosyltransferase involved in cell wall biosynthesis
MRIAIINWTTRKVGGVETYLNTITPELAHAGHSLAFFSEVDGPSERIRIQLLDNAPSWCVASLGARAAVDALRAWQPDVIYCHKLADPALEAQLQTLAPSVFFAHDYNGTCISGTKTFQFPVVQPCSRRFGWQCLVHYFPHRCGGLSPITMLELYRLQSQRLKNLHTYNAIVTHSEHMIAELARHGLSPQRAYDLPYSAHVDYEQQVAASLIASPETCARDHAPDEWRLLFSGRMVYLKGGHLLLTALPEVARALVVPLRLTFAGDGRERTALERQAASLRSPNLKIDFRGWLEPPQMEELLAETDLLVVPSLWPEPFGLVGPEAGLRGVPVAAFAVGGIPDWLFDGVNGFLARASPPSATGLAEAIIKCLADPETHARLRAGALKESAQFNLTNHLRVLLDLFEKVRRRKETRPPTPQASLART